MATTDIKPFMNGHSYKMILIMFTLACLAGTWWEEIMYYFQHGEWVSRTGTVIGPFSPIYGFGAIMFTVFLGPNYDVRPLWKVLLYSAIIGGVVEFGLSWIAEKVFHEIIWDYHDFPTNIMGRTSVIHMVAWGIGGTVLMKLIYPWLVRLFGKIPNSIGMPVWIILLVFMVINMFLTYGSLGRQAIRHSGKPPYTIVGEFFDKVYTDEWLAERFPAIGFNNEAKDTAKPVSFSDKTDKN